MEIVIKSNADAAATLTAQLIAARVRAKPDLVLGSATGRTMEAVYTKLAALELDFSRCRSFNLDEYIGVPPTDKHSYRCYMDERLFDKINIVKTNTHVPDGMASDLGAEVARYRAPDQGSWGHRPATARHRRGRSYWLQRTLYPR